MQAAARFVSKSQYARDKGFSRQYVHKLIQQRVIRCDETNGLIDPEEADILLAARRDVAKPQSRKGQAAVPAEPKKKSPKGKQKPARPTAEPKRKAQGEPDRKHRDPEPEDLGESGNSTVSSDADEVRKLSVEHLAAKVKHERERGNIAALIRRKREGELVEVAEVKRAQSERASEEREALMEWPARFGADIAAELGLEEARVVGVLAVYMRRHLEERSRRQ